MGMVPSMHKTLHTDGCILNFLRHLLTGTLRIWETRFAKV